MVNGLFLILDEWVGFLTNFFKFESLFNHVDSLIL